MYLLVNLNQFLVFIYLCNFYLKRENVFKKIRIRLKHVILLLKKCIIK